MKSAISESEVEDYVLGILKELGYKTVYGPDIDPDSKNPKRSSWGEVLLEEDLNEAIKKFNPQLSNEEVEEVVKKLKRLNPKDTIKSNEKFHKFLTEGVPLEYRAKNGRIVTDNIKLIDYNNPKNNEFKAINQFSIIENNNHRRPDIVIFVNGLPLAVFELKNPSSENADLTSAYKQLKTYMKEIPRIFSYNELLVLSDGVNAQVGTITSPREWFLAWKTINGESVAPRTIPQIEVLLKGLFNKNIFLDVIQYFITFSKSRKQTAKLLAGYHQYYAANKAIKKTIEAVGKTRKAGIIWHTQGSGKSLTLAFYVGKLQVQEELNNPTFVVLTDRNDLDDQLFQTFSKLECLRETPRQATSKEELKKLLKRTSGGIIFTTIQKFDETFETLSKRSNIIVAADEAHRTQYGFKAKADKETGKISYGFAKYLRDALPNATFIGFTGTPIELEDRSTKAVFGNYIDIYDIEQSVDDHRTVRIYYESRLIPLKIKDKDLLDKTVEEVTEKEEYDKKHYLKSKWARLERIVGAKSRIKKLAKDIVTHFEKRLETLDGKGMVVCMSRRIAIELHDEIKKLRPEWYDKDDDKGFMKVVITGSAADGPEWQEHIRDKRRRRELANKFKDPSSDFKLAIVRDMWLTGFDAPSLHTLYVDKPMKGHGLMQAIARVNRVYKDKQGGLVVDYLGIAHELKKALSTYTKSGGKGKPTFDQKEAIAIMLEKFEVVSQMFYGFDYKQFFTAEPKKRMQIIMNAMDHILKLKDGKKRYFKEVSLLIKAFSLSIPSKEAEKIRDEVAFFQMIKSSLVKNTETKESISNDERVDSVIRQIMSKSIVSEDIVDVFKVAGIKKPEISILSDEFLDEVKNLKQKNLAFEVLKKIMADQIKVIYRKNKIKNEKFSEMLEKTIREYQNRSITSVQVIQELLEIAKDIKEDKKKGKELGLSPEEEAFYDALANNKSAVEILGTDTLKKMAFELTELIRKNVTIDWTKRKAVQAKIRIMIKHLLRKYGYPPDKQKLATDLVLDQAKLLAEDFAIKQ